MIDLQDPRCRDRAPGDPLVARILAPSERPPLDAMTDRGGWLLRLWSSWAAKEAAYKVLCKAARNQGPFIPRALVCDLGLSPPDADAPSRIRGTVRAAGSEVVVTVTGTSNGRHVHVLAWSGLGDRPSGGHLEMGLEEVDLDAGNLDEFHPRFSPAEWRDIRSRPSALVRLSARARIESVLHARPSATEGTGSGPAVEILTSRADAKRLPPRIEVEGKELPEWDLSLSHHGRYVAWALLIPD